MELTRNEWAKAEAIARELALEVDRNELGKVVAYAKRRRNLKQVLALVERLPESGYIRSGRTRGYLQRIATVLKRELAGLENDRGILVLGWAFRLLTTTQTERGGRSAEQRAGRQGRR